MGQMVLLEQELSTRLVPHSGNSAPVDHLRRVHLYFIPQEDQVITQDVQSVDRQQIQIQVVPAEQNQQSWRNEVTCSGSSTYTLSRVT